jgi:GTPase
MLPTIAIVGRPNVGKSTLFNALTKTRDALVADQPGLTRDRQIGRGCVGDSDYWLIDTGGLSTEDDAILERISHQARLAIKEADGVLFLVDGRGGLTGADEEIAQDLRRFNTPIFLVINKTEGLQNDLVSAEFHQLGFENIHAISAVHRQGIYALMEEVLPTLGPLPSPPIEGDEIGPLPSPLSEGDEISLLPNPSDGDEIGPLPTPPPEGEGSSQEEQGIKVAIIGRPNVGKSTLVNRMLGYERVITFDKPGTTRDSIFIPFERDGQLYTLIDTAGVRRRARISERIEKFSVIKSLQAIETAHVVIMLLDGSEGITDQDANLLGIVIDSGRALVIAVNKWDGLEQSQREQVRYNLNRKLHFMDFAKIHFISALHGSNVGHLFESIKAVWDAANKKIKTPHLNQVLKEAVMAHPPPLVRGRSIKLRYAHQAGNNPPRFIIHGNQVKELPNAYQRYLINHFRKTFVLEGTPIHLEFKQSENPYAGRKNTLKKRQQKKRERLFRHVKKK